MAVMVMVIVMVMVTFAFEAVRLAFQLVVGAKALWVGTPSVLTTCKIWLRLRLVRARVRGSGKNRG